jgi:cation diffusion facilitator family transporter
LPARSRSSRRAPLRGANSSGGHATVSALAANVGIALAKFVAFAFTGSASMLAEGIHSVADTSNQALLLLGLRRARKPPTDEHPFGFGRERYFWSFVVAVVLFTIGGVASLIDGYEKVRAPGRVTSPEWAFGVLAVSIVLESLSLRVAVREANEVRRGSWRSYVRDAKAPEVVVLIVEDAGALIGLLFALTGVTLATVLHDERFDAIGSLAIGGLLCALALILASELRSLLIGEAATPENIAAIDAAIREAPELEELIYARTLHIGPDTLVIGAKVRLRADLTFEHVVDVINAMEKRIRERVPVARYIYIEPDRD